MTWVNWSRKPPMAHAHKQRGNRGECEARARACKQLRCHRMVACRHQAHLAGRRASNQQGGGQQQQGAGRSSGEGHRGRCERQGLCLCAVRASDIVAAKPAAAGWKQHDSMHAKVGGEGRLRRSASCIAPVPASLAATAVARELQQGERTVRQDGGRRQHAWALGAHHAARGTRPMPRLRLASRLARHGRLGRTRRVPSHPAAAAGVMT